jgi:membrane protein
VGGVARVTDRLPGLAPVVRRVRRSRVWCVYRHLAAHHWDRLAGAITSASFVALFPVLALTGALGAAVLTRRHVDRFEHWFAEQVPGISARLDLSGLFDNAHTVGLVSLPLVLFTGAGWVDLLRGCLRELWDLPDPPGNPVLRRVKDVGVLAGLGAVVGVSLAGSTLATAGVDRAGDRLGLAGSGAGAVVLAVAASAVALGVTFLSLVYLLVWLPGVRPPRGALLAGCVIGTAGFELLKMLLGGYLTEVATRSAYGAFGVPVALVVWINLTARLLLVCCAWTATAPALPTACAAGDGAGDRDPREEGDGVPVRRRERSGSGGPGSAADDGGGTGTPRSPAARGHRP